MEQLHDRINGVYRLTMISDQEHFDQTALRLNVQSVTLPKFFGRTNFLQRIRHSQNFQNFQFLKDCENWPIKSKSQHFRNGKFEKNFKNLLLYILKSIKFRSTETSRSLVVF